MLNSFNFLTARARAPTSDALVFLQHAGAGAEIFVIRVYAASLYSCNMHLFYVCLPRLWPINLRPRLVERSVNLGGGGEGIGKIFVSKKSRSFTGGSRQLFTTRNNTHDIHIHGER